jgi:hypothetical protein
MLNKKLQDEVYLAKCKKNKVLPENILPTKDSIPDEDFAVIAHYTYYAFLLADICYSEMFDLVEKMLKCSSDLKGDSKKRFNEFIRAMETAKRAAGRCSIDIGKYLSEERVDKFIELSDYLKRVFYSVYNRTFTGHDTAVKMMCVVENFPEYKKEQIIQEHLNNKKHD